MTLFLLGGAIGTLVAFLTALPICLYEWLKPGSPTSLPLLVDITQLWGHPVSSKALFLLGLFLHLFTGAFYGALYPWFASQVPSAIFGVAYTLWSHLSFALVTWILMGGLLFPLFGLGFFGRKERGLVWLELLLSMLLIGIGMWLAVSAFQPVFFT